MCWHECACELARGETAPCVLSAGRAGLQGKAHAEGELKRGCLRAPAWPGAGPRLLGGPSRNSRLRWPAPLACWGLDRTLQILLQTAEANGRGRKEMR